MSTGRGLGRQRMVADLASRGIRTPAVVRALSEIPRERFVDEALASKAYSDSPLPIGEKQTISQPWIVGRMCELAEPDGRGKVLEIGTGSGYHAAVLSRLFELVYTVERLPALSHRARSVVRDLQIPNVHFKIFDGTLGWGEFAPYRAIVVTAAAPSVPSPLTEQLDDGGVLVVPVSTGPDEQTLVRVRRTGDRLVEEDHGRCRFVPLIGRFGWKDER